MLIVCPSCLTANRVPDQRTAEDPVCGKCKQPLLDGQPVDLGDANFDAVAAKSELPIVVDFWAAWCGPCQMMAPHFKQAAERLKGRALFVKVDSDVNPQTATRFGVRSIPTMLLLQAGREVKRQVGATQAAQIVAWVGSGG